MRLSDGKVVPILKLAHGKTLRARVVGCVLVIKNSLMTPYGFLKWVQKRG